MVNVDKSNLKQKHKDAQMCPLLPDYVVKVSLIKPTCDFFVDDDCIGSRWVRTADGSDTEYINEIYRVKVRQDGEVIGYLSVNRDQRAGQTVDVYGVGSFRIDKSRGRSDETRTKDIKVALRNVKKFLVGRDYTELARLIKETVTANISSIRTSCGSRIQYGVNTQALALHYSLLAYDAKQKGFPDIILSSDTKAYVRDKESHESNIATYLEVKALEDMIDNKQGYGLSLYTNGSCAMYDFSTDSVRRYKSIDELPDVVQTRLAMFKVIEMHEPHSAFGCKFPEEMYFIVSGELQVQS